MPRLSVAGHDRGGRVAHRISLDRADGVDRLAVLDIVPTEEAFRRADARFALGFCPWSLLAQPSPLPERLILGDPAAVVDDALGRWGSDPSAFPPEVRAAYVQGWCGHLPREIPHEGEKAGRSFRFSSRLPAFMFK